MILTVLIVIGLGSGLWFLASYQTLKQAKDQLERDMEVQRQELLSLQQCSEKEDAGFSLGLPENSSQQMSQELVLVGHQQANVISTTQPAETLELPRGLSLKTTELPHSFDQDLLPVKSSCLSEPLSKCRIHQKSALAHLGQRGLAETDLSKLMDEAVALAAETLNVNYCHILEILPNQTTLFLRAGYGWSEGLVGLAMLGMQPNSHNGYTLRQTQPVIIEDLPLEIRFSASPFLHNHRVVSGVSLVIPETDKSFGILGVYTTESRTFSEDDISFLQAIANILSAAIARKRSEERLHLLERAVNASSNGIVITDAIATDNPVIYANHSFERVTGYSAREVIGHNCRFLQGTDTRQPVLYFLRDAIQEGKECHAVVRNYRKDGSLFWNELHISPVYSAEGHLTNFVGIQTDITERKQAEEDLRKSEEQFRLTFELAPIGMAISSLEGQFLKVNQALCDAFGYTPAELLTHTHLEITHPDDLGADLLLTEQLIEGAIQQFQLEKRYLAKKGNIIHTLLQVVLVRDADGKPLHTVSQIVNITDRKQMEERLLHDAFHDVLTGLPNRALFEDRLGQAIQRKKQSPDYLFAVLFLDLDRFKLINDSLGHMMGDQLLIAIAQKLQACLRPTDTIARLGGDEFTVLLENIQEPEDAEFCAKRILRELNRPFDLNGQEIFTKASIGVALSGIDYDRPEELLRDADIAMYRAKDLGKARYEVFDKVMHTHAIVRLRLETDLQRALLDEEFQLYYQPIIALDSEKLTGFEVLLRWQHPEQGLISPDQFIPIAEETGLIVPIGEWVLQSACQQLQSWQTELPATQSLNISVNLSGRQICESNLIERIDHILKSTGLDSQRLKLEITESVIMENTEPATKILSELRERHIELCIDDFGTGYSSLSYLHRFPVNVLKIDRSFVSRMKGQDENAEIVRTIVTLAHTLGMNVIAEGIETHSQFKQLQTLGCEQGQGYLFSRPLDTTTVEAFIREQC